MLASVITEYHRYKSLGESAIAQVQDADLTRAVDDSNSIAVIVWHISGNLRSRFTDFRTSDGEKPWRNRDEEFVERVVPRAELLAKWEAGWAAVFGALAKLTDADLQQSVTIRGQSLTVADALLRSVTHTSYHVGQIVYLAKSFRGSDWKSLSIPKGGSAAYNKNPDREKVKQ